jgi:hypothetical protein
MSVFSDTTWHESNHPPPFNQSTQSTQYLLQYSYSKFSAGKSDGGGVGFLMSDSSSGNGGGDAAACIRMKDHTYDYSVCLGSTPSEARQGSTKLGTLDSVSVEDATGTMLISFTEGDHCWNHGARVAQVTVRCGPEDVLLSVHEPSTCVYDMEMASPQACSPLWKEVNHL